jgi:hypothetical protein
VEKQVGERRQGRFSNRMHSRGHDLGLTRCSAFPAEAASRSCLSLLLADLQGKLFSLSHRLFRVGEGYRRSPEQRRAQETAR